MKVLRNNEDYEFLLGESALDLFYYFQVEELHGLNIHDCRKRIEEGGTYIDGMCNYIPVMDYTIDYSKFFIFINLSSLDGSYKDITLVQHETTHGGFKMYDYNPNREEEIISWGEKLTNDVMPQIFREVNKRRYKDIMK